MSIKQVWIAYHDKQVLYSRNEEGQLNIRLIPPIPCEPPGMYVPKVDTTRHRLLSACMRKENHLPQHLDVHVPQAECIIERLDGPTSILCSTALEQHLPCLDSGERGICWTYLQTSNMGQNST